MIDIERRKAILRQLPIDRVAEAVLELRLEGLVLSHRTPFERLHFNTCFAEVEALLRRAGYQRRLEVQGYQGQLYALYDPARWQPIQVLRWLRTLGERAAQQRANDLRQARRTQFFQG